MLDTLPFTSPAASSRFSLAMKSNLRWNGSAGFPSLGIEETVRNKFIVSNKTRTRVFCSLFKAAVPGCGWTFFKKKQNKHASIKNEAGWQEVTHSATMKSSAISFIPPSQKIKIVCPLILNNFLICCCCRASFLNERVKQSQYSPDTVWSRSPSLVFISTQVRRQDLGLTTGKAD